ncbi:MAG: acriflavin resistance protein [Marmoricola sp.]|nr:acriflavin resistance protein [Marmoricola sp.]
MTVTSWLISRAMAARVLVLTVAGVLVVLGTLRAREAQTEVLPEFSPPYVEVQTEALGLSAEEVEQLITAPMENLLLNGVAFLDGIRSESVNGLSSITLIFERGTDPLEARQVVQERLTQQRLLAHLTEPPVIVQPRSSSSRVLVVGFRSQRVSPIQMSVLARWTIRPQLLGVPGVANVSIFGQRERQLQVQVQPRRLARHGVTLQQVINTTGNALWVSPLTFLNASAPGTGGFVDSPSTRLEIRHVSPIVSPKDLRQVALERPPGSPGANGLTLGDVARVTEDHQPLIGDAVVNDGPGLVMVVEKFPGANTVEVTKGIEAALETLRPGLDGVSVDTNLFRPATFVDQARDNYVITLGAGLLLALLLTLLFLLHLRATLIVLVSTVVSLSGTAVLLEVLGMALDSMVLAGLALATTVLVQDSVVDVQHVVRRLRGRPGAEVTPASVIRDASLEMRRAMGFATAIVLVALVPLLVLDPLSEAFYRPALVAFALATVTSMIVALTVTPALSSVLLRGGPVTGPRGSLWLEATVADLSRRVVHAVRPVLVVLALAVVAGALVVPFLRASQEPGLLPRFKESDLVVSWRGNPGISRTGMTTIAAELGAELRAVPGVRNVGGHVGRAVLSDRVNGIGQGELWVGIDAEADYAETVADVRAVTEGYDRASAEVRSYFSDRLEAGGALISDTDRGRVEARDDEVVVRVYGEELPVLAEQAKAIERTLSGVNGVTKVKVELPPVGPNLEVEVDLAAAKRHGLKPGDIRRAATTLAAGLKAGSLFEEQKVFDVVVNGARGYFEDPARIGELPIDTPDGGTVRLDQVADVRQGTSFSVINRESVSRRLDLVVTVSGDRADAADAIEASLATVDFPREYHAEVIGNSKNAVDLGRLLLWGGCSLAAMILLLQAAVRSWRLVAAALAVIAFSMAGGLLALGLTGAELTIGAVLGFAAVLGLAVRNLLGLVGYYHALRAAQDVPFGADLAIRGAAERGVPTVLSGAVVLAVLLPVAFAGARPGLEILYPMAVVVIGGAVTATLAPLVLFPTLYLRWGEHRESDLVEDLALPAPVQA